MNYEDILNLIKTIEKSSFEKFEIEFHGTKLKLSKGESYNYSSHSNNLVVNEEIKKENIIETFEKTIETKEEEEVSGPITILPKEKEEISGSVVKSPIVGTFYSSSNPDSPPFVKVGDSVNVGDVLCIVEAMKVMNEVTSSYNGVVVNILAKDEELVEFNKPLFVIEER